MFGIGLPEMILILALALIVVGPDKLPDLARSLAKGIMELKKTAEGLKQTLKEEGNPLDDIKPDLEDAAKTLQSHLLDHPEHGKSSLFPTEGVNPTDNSAAQAYEELAQKGVNTSDNLDKDEPIDLTTDDLTEVVIPEDEEVNSEQQPVEKDDTKNTDSGS